MSDSVCSGQEDFSRIRSLAYEDTHVFMICFSVDSRDSLDNITEHWVHEVQSHAPNAKFVLVALKCDLRDDEAALMKYRGDEPILYDQVGIRVEKKDELGADDIQQGLAVARMIHASSYLECSAKHNRGVKVCFEQVARVAMGGNVLRFFLRSTILTSDTIQYVSSIGGKSRQKCVSSCEK